MRRWSVPAGITLGLLLAGCHREVEMIPLKNETFYRTDKFFDIQALGKGASLPVLPQTLLPALTKYRR